MALTAQIRTRDGWAVAHAVITLTDTAGGQVLRAEADQDGVVTDDTVLKAGAYVAIVTAIGWTPTASTAIVTASGKADLGTVTLTRQGESSLPTPGPWTIDPVHSSVGAVAQHLGISSVRGRFTDFSGVVEIAPQDLARSRVEAIIRAASIDTGNSMRDGHLKSADFLDVENHPEIVYRSTGLTPTGSDRWTVHGELSMHGQTREVDLDVTYLGTGPDPWGGTRAAFHATAQLRREDFAMNYNQAVAAGIAAIGTTLKVELDIQAVQGDSLPG
ncbi:polyisoprenoid-binding protein YceI [Nocardioides albertanoniae]|uniref:Polyisoprenoid-binding protein YceI n=1 Tax=Nocardioides albertanoniae TaxID=1175486 RepID=A0A543A499_9ACTN|nr:YceI family protein [Nocardioides albertanoniae]TQL67397.1 polyisoprenoid-binding protein YceI [Nocardioides albertanoniae]